MFGSYRFPGIRLFAAALLAMGAATAAAQGSGRPQVEVVNPPDRPVNTVVLNSRTPILLGRQIAGDSNGNLRALGQLEDFVVPADKQLVLEYVSMESLGVTLAPGQAYLGFFSKAVGRRLLAGSVTAQNSLFNFGPDTGQLIAIRYAPGESVTFSVFSNFPLLVNVAVSGYLEDLR